MSPLILWVGDGKMEIYLSSIGRNLICPKCRALLGIAMIYKKENRPAVRLFAGAVGKGVVSGEKVR